MAVDKQKSIHARPGSCYEMSSLKMCSPAREGMTLVEHTIIEMAKGILANAGTKVTNLKPAEVASQAMQMTDALFAELAAHV